jgi:hypothetical protein
MRRSALEKATLVRGAAARKTFAARLFRTYGLKFFRRTRQLSDGQPQIGGLA